MVWVLAAGPLLHPLNERLIYATASGYGISGPNRSDLAMDLTVQAASGIMSVTGFADGPPVRTGVTVADFMGGIHAYGAIMTALFERERSGIRPAGRGRHAGGRLFHSGRTDGAISPTSGLSRLAAATGQAGATAPFGVFEVKRWFRCHSHRNGSALVQHFEGSGPH